MANLFGGTPQSASSYTTSTSETPKWMQDAIYNQVNWATNVAQTPYEQYQGQLVAGLSPYQQAAYQQTVNDQGAWVPAMNQAQVGTGALTNTNAASAAASPYLQAGTSTSGLSAAMPYVNQADQNAYTNVNQYMNPYTQNVTDMIAKLGARNLSENLLPSVSDAFVRAGQFGGTRMGEFGARALRDTQESILNQQAQALQSGYGQALSASQTDAARQAQLAGTVGGLASSQQQALLNAGQTAGQLASTDVSQKLAAQNQLGALSQQAASLAAGDTSRLEAAGSAYQTQQQRELDAQYQQYLQQLNYPKTQLDWLSTQVRGMAPNAATTTSNVNTSAGNTGLSPLSQIATGLSVGAGLSKLLS